MLVLSRRLGERIVIGEDTELAVLEIRGKTVRLGFTAAQSKVIRRAELLCRDPPSEIELQIENAPTNSTAATDFSNTHLLKEFSHGPVT